MTMQGMTSLAALAVFGLALGGCVPAPVKVAMQPGSRVTIINALDPAIANSHLGVTAFSTYAEPIANDWHLPQDAAQVLVEALHDEGIEASALDVGTSDRERLSNPMKLDRALNPRASGEDGAFRQWLLAVMRQTSASTLVVLRGFGKPVAYNSTFYYASYGVLSAWGFKPDNATLFANTAALVLNGEALVPAPSTNWKEGDCRKQIATAGFAVDNLKDLKAADLEPFRADLTKMVATRLRQDLVTAGLIKAAFPPCAF